MHRFLNFLFLVVLSATLAMAQQHPAAHSAGTAHPSAKPAEAKSADTTSLPSAEVVESFLRQTFGYDSSLSWKVGSIKPAEAAGLAEVDVTISGPQGSQPQKFYVTPDGTHAVIGEILPFGSHPYDATWKKLEKGLNGPSHGPADASVTLVEFGDLQCPHCKDAQPAIEKVMEDEKGVRIVFQNFPLPMHDWAMKAAEYADCVGQTSNDAFWKFIASVYGAQSDITAANADEKLTTLADGAGVKGADISACAAKPETTSRVEKSIDLAKSLDITSTPTIFINGRKLAAGGIPYEVLHKLVAFAQQEAKPKP